jgi:hypothetical protein
MREAKKVWAITFSDGKYYQPATILELGTSLGITTSYLSLAKPGCKNDNNGGLERHS